jgi:hypothetical protein
MHDACLLRTELQLIPDYPQSRLLHGYLWCPLHASAVLSMPNAVINDVCPHVFDAGSRMAIHGALHRAPLGAIRCLVGSALVLVKILQQQQQQQIHSSSSSHAPAGSNLVIWLQQRQCTAAPSELQ